MSMSSSSSSSSSCSSMMIMMMQMTTGISRLFSHGEVKGVVERAVLPSSPPMHHMTTMTITIIMIDVGHRGAAKTPWTMIRNGWLCTKI